ncbi:MAG TPA: hypothetical protein VG944_20420, partial [Fimbriimonas sp.]|nr:hypothetical protein [Fimbriimonas sp.]
MMTGTVVLVRAGVIASAMVGIATAVGLIPRQMPPQFSSEERTQLVQYWSDPSRYSVGEPASAAQKGLWQVRLTPEGSTWLWSYNRARKISTPPTADAKPQNDQQKAWETWIVAKVHHDRWQALQEARAANQQAQGLELPLPDKDTPLDEPQDPGPIPTDLEVLAGDPPPFAASVSPKQFSINFDDGTIQYQDNVKLGSPRYAYYRFSDGVMSEGTVVKNVDPSRLDKLFALAGCDDTQSHVMRAVSQLEGGFDAVNTYDTGYVSVGFIQFASLKEGSGSLGTMLLSYKQDDPADFAADFHRYGVDVQPNGLLDVVDPETGTEEFGPDANR